MINNIIKKNKYLLLIFVTSSLCMCTAFPGDKPTPEIQEWNRYFSTSSTEFIMTMAIDKTGNIYAGGISSNYVNSASNYDYLARKITYNGDLITGWFGGSYSYSSSGSIIDYLQEIAVDSDNNVYLCGFSNEDWLIKKFNSSGTENISWNKSIDFHGSYDRLFACAIDSSDNIYVGGYSNNSGNRDWRIKKFSKTGVEQSGWDKVIDGGSNDEGIQSIAIDSDDNVYVAGILNGNMVIRRYSSNGTADSSFNIILGSTSGNIDIPQLTDIAIDSTDTVYVMYDNLIIKKISSVGTVDGSFTVDYSTTSTYITSIVIDKNDILCVAGAGVDLIGTDTPSDYDGYIRFYDSDGNLLDETLPGVESESDYIRSMVVSSNNSIYFGGRSFNAIAVNSSSDWWIGKIQGYTAK